MLIGGGIAALILLVGAVVVVALSGGSGGGASSQSTSSVTSASTTVTTIATTTTRDPVTAARIAMPQLYDLAVRLENILQQSSQGRGRVGPLVSSVRSCTIAPSAASAEIDQVITNRRTVLTQISSLSNNAGAEGTAMIATLQTAIQNSIDADVYYSSWMRYLYTRYSNTNPVGCPSGSAPTNADFDTADAYSRRATTAKQQFVDLFNPVAERFGLATWDEGTI